MKKKIVSWCLFILHFAYFYKTCRQIRKIPRLQSAHINFNNWILHTTKLPRPAPLKPPGFQPVSPSWSKKTAPRLLFKFQLPSESQGAPPKSFFKNISCFPASWCLLLMGWFKVALGWVIHLLNLTTISPFYKMSGLPRRF